MSTHADTHGLSTHTRRESHADAPAHTRRFDLAERRMELSIETLPLLPRMRVLGEELEWDEVAQTLTYTVGKKPPSTWRILFVDRERGVIAARSSVTGLNVIHRVSS